ncbi:MAG: sigma-70 family RNA polymerase sigma factor [Sphingobacteriales bacterium]|nr:MAG: sigma-70 family RNA polymerase sigma factor [Sphingobacteriales bacterium]
MELTMALDRTHTDAFIADITLNERLIYKVCSMYAADAEERKDLFQEVVLQAWSAYPRFQQTSSFGTWLYRIALNTAINYKRKSARSITSSFDDFSRFDHLSNISSEDEENYKLMHRLIGSLPSFDKALVMLYMDDYTYQQIADIMGISASNVGAKLSRIKEKLKKQANSNQ